MTDLLPSVIARDPRLKAIANLSERLGDLDVTQLMVYLISHVPKVALPFLAEQFSLIGDGWELATTEAAQRDMIKGALEIHRHKGTPWAVKQVFVLLGLGAVDIDEGRSGYRRDGSMRRDGFPVRGDRSAHWTEYRIRCHHLLSVQQARQARKLLASIAPARCQLIEINFSGAALARNGAARRDGSYTRGTV